MEDNIFGSIRCGKTEFTKRKHYIYQISDLTNISIDICNKMFEDVSNNTLKQILEDKRELKPYWLFNYEPPEDLNLPKININL